VILLSFTYTILAYFTIIYDMLTPVLHNRR